MLYNEAISKHLTNISTTYFSTLLFYFLLLLLAIAMKANQKGRRLSFRNIVISSTVHQA